MQESYLAEHFNTQRASNLDVGSYLQERLCTQSQTITYTDQWKEKDLSILKKKRGRDKFGDWDRLIHTTIYKIGNK